MRPLVATDPASPRSARALLGSGPRIFVVAFVIFFGAGAIWSAAVPLLGGPDEPSHMVKAAAVAHGEWTALCYDLVGSKCVTAPNNAAGLVALPSFYSMIKAADKADPPNSQICFHSHSTIPASCARSLDRSPDATDIKFAFNKFAWTSSARYPPLYYFIVGQPSHFGGSTIDLYLMRLISAALGAIFLALAVAVALVYSRNRLLLLGLVLAITPMVLFLDGVVNPSALEVTSAICFFTAGTVLVTERLGAPPKGLVATLGVSAIFFENTRSLSPFWLAIDAIVLLALTPSGHIRAALHQRSLQLCAAVVALFGGAAIWWILAEHATDVVPVINSRLAASDATIIETELRYSIEKWIPTMVGIFGWFDAPSPVGTFVIWFALAGLLLIGAFLATSARGRLLLVAFLAGIVLLPVLISAPHAHVDGYLWSGRDTMPFALGLPIVAAALLGTSAAAERIERTLGRFVPAILGLLAIAQFAGFYAALRRWSVGSNGAVAFFAHPSWQPAIGVVAALVLEALVLVVLSAFFALALRRPIPPEHSLAEPPGEASGDASSLAVGSLQEAVH